MTNKQDGILMIGDVEITTENLKEFKKRYPVYKNKFQVGCLIPTGEGHYCIYVYEPCELFNKFSWEITIK